MPQQLHINGQTAEEESIEFLRQHEPPEGYFGGFSGGKDSIVLKHLAGQAGVKVHWYYTLMPDPPELIRFIRTHHRDVNIIKAPRNFYQQVETRFPPNRKNRWCCDYIKEKPSIKIPLTQRILGVRAEESPARRKKGIINIRTKKRINYHPIFDWLEWEVWEYIDRHNIPYCSLYDEGFSRLGCVPCPMRSTKELEKYRERWPQIFRLFEKSCYRWWETKGHHRQRVRGYAMLFDEYMERWYRGT